jgi:hypothetical protein
VWSLWRAPARWSLARQYLLVVVAGVLVTGAWIGHQIEASVLARTGAVTAIYVDSVLGPHLQALALDDRWLTAADTDASTAWARRPAWARGWSASRSGRWTVGSCTAPTVT